MSKTKKEGKRYAWTSEYGFLFYAPFSVRVSPTGFSIVDANELCIANPTGRNSANAIANALNSQYPLPKRINRKERRVIQAALRLRIYQCPRGCKPFKRISDRLWISSMCEKDGCIVRCYAVNRPLPKRIDRKERKG